MFETSETPKKQEQFEASKIINNCRQIWVLFQEKNMARQISPGVVIKERDLTAGTVVNSSAVSAAIVSTFQKGPINEVITISSQR